MPSRTAAAIAYARPDTFDLLEIEKRARNIADPAQQHLDTCKVPDGEECYLCEDALDVIDVADDVRYLLDLVERQKADA